MKGETVMRNTFCAINNSKERAELQNGLNMFVIKDADTSEYLSSRSFWTMDGQAWDYFTYTGKIGTSFHTYLETAENALAELQHLNKLSGLNRKLVIDVVNVDNLSLGKTAKVLQ